MYGYPNFVNPVDWSGRREDSCGISGTGETPQELLRRGGSPPAPRKAKRLEWKSTDPIHKRNKKDCRHSIFIEFVYSLKETARSGFFLIKYL
ncbi:hypothetical protein F9802_13235 [Bacillus aerolatus]|uniref:Uncharacterized protein n=1 Tax=Bacillus aerolatus TaxID=2653354 RepID=A0A6I1FHF9_9BACI|nr:hypothetical protein F9802_13235 [Bacillus aerolatus]